ncbi:ABC1 kinase family protein [Acidiphilium acidophilum]|uniref:AarF/ABC1/UbiB kinase family protein n=1 Tax=Acidiphilium acidophilum TaxID=76588 RepID=A0AAW9DQQ2_ACIAO|nr:AarF/ABC1/UbiB kinase family protein [Acidiphilium acidophilum]MDX5931451.1 AarF/ABC1/UbiB kinase family protein [Acidiphilium acidophilum]
MVNEVDSGSTLFGEFKRFARTSGAVSGIAARVAGNRVFGIKTDRARHAEDLKTILGGLKGPMMKVAQILTTIPDALPEEYAKELAQLQANAPAMGWVFVRRRMAAELGPDWEAKFRSFGHEAAAAASLGQVHRAMLPDGRDVACKLQYPDMASTVEADLRQLKLAMAVYKRMDNAIHQEDIYVELATRLREELDYQREAAQARLYTLMLEGQPDIVIPTPVPEFSTKRLLTMTWLTGTGMQTWLDTDPPLEARNRIARALFRAWYVPFYRYGVIHGDPHLGNYQVNPEGGINLLDFGAIRVFGSNFVAGVIELFNAIRDNDDEHAHHAYKIWGFTDITKEKLDVLNDWARFLYEPLMQDRVRPIQETNDVTYGRSVAERVHEGLKRTGGIRPPREFVLMDRSAIGLGSVFLRLRAELNWQQLFHETVADFDESALEARQTAALAEAGVPKPL